MKIDLIAGARPNLMKVAPLLRAFESRDSFSARLVHTGQHYDDAMSQVFFDDFGLRKPDAFLDVRGGSHAVQTARIMEKYEPLCLSRKPDLVIVVGDVNSTLACAIVAKKCHVGLAHLEAGLRSYDREMPEEINRIATDAISDILFTDSQESDDTLLKEGHSPDQIVRVGNIMLDAYELARPKIEATNYADALGLSHRKYGVVTMHRPSNVDSTETLSRLVDALILCAKDMHLIFPVHPRTKKNLAEFGLLNRLEGENITLLNPIGYVAFMSLVSNCAIVVTDSGGIQEETTYLGVPCITVRENTERPITLELGTNQLCGIANLPDTFHRTAASTWPTRPTIPLWDGKTTERVIEYLDGHLT